MATIEELSKALINADAAGDADAARQLASAIRGMQGGAPSAPAETAPDLDPSTGMPAGMVLDPKTGQVVDTNARAELLRREGGAMQGVSDMAGQFVAGTPIVGEYLDEAAGAIGGDMAKENARAKLRSYEEANPWTAAGLRLAGGINGTIPMVMSGASFGANAATAGQGLGRIAMGSAADGAIAGAAAGFGSGDGLDDRVSEGVTGLAKGLGIGVATPLAGAGLSTIAGPLFAPIMSRLRPDAYANRYLGEGLKRSTSSADDVAIALMASRADGQDVFTVADALGHSGQRMLSTVTRTPNDARQGVVEALLRRQAGQGRRLQAALIDGFGAPQTKAQTEAALEATRKAEAGINYGAARSSAGSVNPSDAIAKADSFLGVSGSLPATGIKEDSVAGAVTRARALLTDGTNVVSDFETAFRAKVELDSMIDNANSTVRAQLTPIRNELDKALEKSSASYANARDTFRRQSQDIEAANVGRDAAMRGRVEDTTPRFQALSRPEQQASFRSGYVDPYIETIQGAVGPMTNKARPLISDATADEFPAFAAPGKAGQLGDRITREQRMFETTNAALGGSTTADNLADQADMGKFDPSLVTTLLKQGPIKAVMEAVTRSIGEAKGLPPTVVERIAKVLMETRPDVARQMLKQAAAKTQTNQGIQAITNAMITLNGASAAGR